mmetsp:Transcript_136485/g.323239  ORF Transcript_136485/g.323239 Transcript_136485/m.323239 type:complete len:137 (-) Transcript_136485:504-914(-)
MLPRLLALVDEFLLAGRDKWTLALLALLWRDGFRCLPEAEEHQEFADCLEIPGFKALLEADSWLDLREGTSKGCGHAWLGTCMVTAGVSANLKGVVVRLRFRQSQPGQLIQRTTPQTMTTKAAPIADKTTVQSMLS